MPVINCFLIIYYVFLKDCLHSHIGKTIEILILIFIVLV